jgi:hypothetical protein
MAKNNDKNGQADGQKARAPPPALNPESCALVQPYKEFVGKGFITSLKVEFTPLGISVFCNVRNDLLNKGEDNNSKLALGDAKQRILDKGLWVPGNRNQKSRETNQEPALPKKTLCKEDFLKTDEALSARALAVAKALTDTTARGRIGSLKLMIEGCDTFENWWDAAAPAEKTRLLADKKHHESFTEEDHIRLNKILQVCPFRGPVPTPTEEEEETLPEQSSKALVQKKKAGK